MPKQANSLQPGLGQRALEQRLAGKWKARGRDVDTHGLGSRARDASDVAAEGAGKGRGLVVSLALRRRGSGRERCGHEGHDGRAEMVVVVVGKRALAPGSKWERSVVEPARSTRRRSNGD